jgi:hypothetical protein
VHRDQDVWLSWRPEHSLPLTRSEAEADAAFDEEAAV